MRVQDIMSTKVQTIWPSQDANDAINEMRSLRIHHLVVVEEKRVIGVISERDLHSRERTKTPTTVRELMTPQVVTVTPSTTVRQTANMLRGRSIGCLPVMVGGRLKGIVTVSDLLELVGRGAPRASLEAH